MNYFSEEELRCPCCKVNGFNKDTLKKLNALREACGFPISLNSAYRCEKYNRLKGFTQTHATGQASDAKVSYKQAFKLLELAPSFGFTGIGVSQKGSFHSRFIHLDDLPEVEGRPRPHVWSY